MLLDIVIPHYNEPWDICKPMIDMINAQKCVDFSKFKVMIVHDGSDPFPLQYIKGPANMVQVPLTHRGVSACRNFGIKSATSDWIQFCDCDDCFSSIYSLANVLYMLESEQSKKFDLMWGPFFMSNEKLEERSVCEKFSSVFIHNKYYRTKFLVDHNILFPEQIHMSEDSAFNAIVKMEIGPHKIGQINTSEPLYSWCRRPGSITMDSSKWLYNTEGHFDRNLYIIDEYLKRGQTNIASLIGRTLTDAYAMLNRSNTPPPSNEFRKRLHDYYIKNQKDFNDLSDHILEQALKASDRDVGTSEENKSARPELKMWIQKELIDYYESDY